MCYVPRLFHPRIPSIPLRMSAIPQGISSQVQRRWWDGTPTRMHHIRVNVYALTTVLISVEIKCSECNQKQKCYLHYVSHFMIVKFGRNSILKFNLI